MLRAVLKRATNCRRCGKMHHPVQGRKLCATVCGGVNLDGNVANHSQFYVMRCESVKTQEKSTTVLRPGLSISSRILEVRNREPRRMGGASQTSRRASSTRKKLTKRGARSGCVRPDDHVYPVRVRYSNASHAQRYDFW